MVGKIYQKWEWDNSRLGNDIKNGRGSQKVRKMCIILVGFGPFKISVRFMLPNVEKLH